MKKFFAFRKLEFAGYFFVSATAFLVDFLIFSGGIRLFGLSWPVAAGLGFFFGAFTAYILSVRLVFKERRLKTSPKAEFFVFFLVGACGLLLTQFTLWLGIEILQLNAELSKVFAAGFTFVFNYLVRRAMLFSNSGQHSLASHKQ